MLVKLQIDDSLDKDEREFLEVAFKVAAFNYLDLVTYDDVAHDETQNRNWNIHSFTDSQDSQCVSNCFENHWSQNPKRFGDSSKCFDAFDNISFDATTIDAKKLFDSRTTHSTSDLIARTIL